MHAGNRNIEIMSYYLSICIYLASINSFAKSLHVSNYLLAVAYEIFSIFHGSKEKREVVMRGKKKC